MNSWTVHIRPANNNWFLINQNPSKWKSFHIQKLRLVTVILWRKVYNDTSVFAWKCVELVFPNDCNDIWRFRLEKPKWQILKCLLTPNMRYIGREEMRLFLWISKIRANKRWKGEFRDSELSIVIQKNSARKNQNYLLSEIIGLYYENWLDLKQGSTNDIWTIKFKICFVLNIASVVYIF